MTTVLSHTAANYRSIARRYSVPVADGLVGLWYLGGEAGDDPAAAQARTIKNMAGTSHAMTLVGSPTISTGYVTVDGSNYLLTTIPETLSFTFLLVAQPLAISGTLLGHQQTGSQTVMNNGASGVGNLSVFSPRDLSGVVGQVNVGNLNTAGWSALKMLSWKINGGTGAVSLRNMTNGTSVTSTITGTRTLVTPAAALKIGGVVATPGAVKVSALAVYNRDLTTDEENAMRTRIAAYRTAIYGDTI